MKANKYTTTLLAVGALSVILLVSDFSSYARGSKSFLLGPRSIHQKTRSDPDDKLSKIGDGMASLSARLSLIESSISKLNKELEKRRDSTDLEEYRDHHNERLAKTNSRIVRKYGTNLSGYSHSIDLRGNAHVGSPVDDILGRSVDDSAPGSRNVASKALGASHNLPEPKSYASETDENGLTPDLDVGPGISRVEIRKVQVSVGPSGKSHKLLPGFKISMDDIFPDLSKEDPIVELKRFDDADSFRTFGNNMRAHKIQENDGSHSTFYKMSDIISSPGSGSSATRDATNINEIQHLPHSGLEDVLQPKYIKNTDALPASKDLTRNTKMSDDSDLIDASASSTTPKTGDGKIMDPFSLYDSIENSSAARKGEFKPRTTDIGAEQTTEKKSKGETSSPETGKKYCDEFENPAEAYKNGRCILGERSLDGLESQAEEFLRNAKHDDVVSSSKEVLSQIKSSISDLETQMRESKKIEDQVAEKTKTLRDKVDFPAVPESAIKEIKGLEQQIKQARQDLENEKTLLKNGMSEEDEIDRVIQKPTNQQVV